MNHYFTTDDGYRIISSEVVIHDFTTDDPVTIISSEVVIHDFTTSLLMIL
ncbi:hypothetical protein PSY62_23610 [Shigella flexneri]|nr:hypothetical protein [Shigella flexneri]